MYKQASVHLEPVSDLTKTIAGVRDALEHLGDTVILGQAETMIRLRNLIRILQETSRSGIDRQKGLDLPELARLLEMLRKALAVTDSSMMMVPSKRMQMVVFNRETLVELMEALDAILAGCRQGMGSGDRGSALEAALEEKSDEQQGTTAVQFALEGLSEIRAKRGRSAADALSRESAKLIEGIFAGRARVAEDDDGFVAIVEGEMSEEELRATTEKVMGAIRGLHRLLTVAAGLIYQEESENALEKLDVATRKAAATGEGGLARYSPELAVEAAEADRKRQTVLAMLDPEADQLFPVFQRIFPSGRTKDKKPKFEALLRTRNPEISTYRFLEIVKDEGRLAEVTALLFPKIAAAVQGRRCELSINITPEELAEPFGGKSFEAFLMTHLQSNRLDPRDLIIELVEWGERDELSPESLSVLGSLVAKGVRLALDDYGVMSSNLVRLMQLCANRVVPDFLKIDAALVKHLNRHVHARDSATLYSETGIRSIVATAAELSHKAGKPVGTVAEFVDNARLQKALEKLGVGYLQGFYLGKPMEAAAVFGS